MDLSPYRGLEKLTFAMRLRVEAFLSDVTLRKIPMIIRETWRTQERQNYLYSLGRTNPGTIVTWTLQSKHILGEAIDVVFVKEGKITDEGDWESIGKIGEAHGLTWGGRWPTPDRPHFQFNPDWTVEHWALPYEQKLLDRGVISYKKNLDDPPTRGELYVILCRLFKL